MAIGTTVSNEGRTVTDVTDGLVSTASAPRAGTSTGAARNQKCEEGVRSPDRDVDTARTRVSLPKGWATMGMKTPEEPPERAPAAKIGGPTSKHSFSWRRRLGGPCVRGTSPLCCARRATRSGVRPRR